MEIVKLEKFDAMSKEQMKKVEGGKRIVEKIDTDGDGRWDMKKITRNNGTVKYVFR